MMHLHEALDTNHIALLARYLGVDQPYDEVLALMHDLHDQVSKNVLPSHLLLLEHRPVITITRSHQSKSILTSTDAIQKSGIDLCVADRGGDATFHGPGQLVGYPIIKLSDRHYLDVAWYVRTLEYALLDAMHELFVTHAQLIPGFTGIWIKTKNDTRLTFKKLIAIGVGSKDGATKHGFALNIDIDHTHYTSHIIPCGLKDRGVITLSEYFSSQSLEMPERSDIVQVVSQNLARAFSLNLVWRA